VGDLRRRLERLEGPRRHGGVYVVRTETQEREALAQAAASGDLAPVIIWRLTPYLG
jgi:hypothetical protein